MRKAVMCALVALMALVGCSARKEPAPAHKAPVQQPAGAEREVFAQTEPIPIAKQMEGQVGIIRMVVTDKGFEPNQITTTVGGRVKIHLVNQGTKVHTLSIPRWGVFTRNLGPGEENYVEFTPGEKGVWAILSDPGEQPEPGLEAQLKVE
jgi:hypothetical protein